MPTIDSAGVSFDATLYTGQQAINEPGGIRYRSNRWASIFFPERDWLWNVSTANFEEIHGMSRVLALMPEKLCTSKELLNEEVVPDPAFPIRLLCGLANQMASIGLGKASDDHQTRESSQQNDWKYNIRSSNFANPPFPPDSDSINDVFLQTIEVLTECESLCNAQRPHLFTEKYREAIEHGRSVAELAPSTSR